MKHQTTSWRDFLTDEERAIIEAGDLAKQEWERHNAPRAGIVNRALQRARYAARANRPLDTEERASNQPPTE